VGAFFMPLDKRLDKGFDDGFFLALRFTGEADSSESDESLESGDEASDSSELSKEGGVAPFLSLPENSWHCAWMARAWMARLHPHPLQQ